MHWALPHSRWWWCHPFTTSLLSGTTLPTWTWPSSPPSCLKMSPPSWWGPPAWGPCPPPAWPLSLQLWCWRHCWPSRRSSWQPDPWVWGNWSPWPASWIARWPGSNSFVLKILLESLRLLRVLVSPYIMRMSFFFESDATENSMLVNTTLLWVSWSFIRSSMIHHHL